MIELEKTAKTNMNSLCRYSEVLILSESESLKEKQYEQV